MSAARIAPLLWGQTTSAYEQNTPPLGRGAQARRTADSRHVLPDVEWHPGLLRLLADRTDESSILNERYGQPFSWHGRASQGRKTARYTATDGVPGHAMHEAVCATEIRK